MRLPLTRARPAAPPDPLTDSHSAAGPERAVRVLAHRGASVAAPENTLAAIRAAAAHGADLVELDVRRTRDGALVLLHDETVARTTDAATVLPPTASWRVGDLTLAQVRRLDAGRGHAPRPAPEPVPTLAEALDLCAGLGLGVQLEVKAPSAYPGIVDDLLAELRAWTVRLGGVRATPPLVVQSFDVTAVKELAARAPHLRVGILGTPPRAHLPVLAGWAHQVNPRHLTADRAYVDRVHALGMGCLVWTVDRPWAMRRALRLGVDGVITNRPDLLRRVLDEQVTLDPGGSTPATMLLS